MQLTSAGRRVTGMTDGFTFAADSACDFLGAPCPRTARPPGDDGLRYESWEALYDRAVSTGCGELVELEEERLAATDELLAAVLPAVTRTGGRLIAAAIVGADSIGSAPLARETAAILRGLDRALAAHGRDNGYEVEAWRSTAVMTAQIVGDSPSEATWLAALLQEAIEQIACVLVALSRDRLGVSELLSAAIGHILVIYAAAEAPQ